MIQTLDSPAGVEEFLSFQLGTEEYGIDILKVQEIRGHDAVTRLANTPAFIKGVIDLRGTIVPIIDLRVKFALDQAEYNQFTVVIILNVASRVIGVVVDGVSDVIALTSEQIKPIPDVGGAIDTRFLYGVASVSGKMILLLDIERLMSSAEIALVDTSLTTGDSHDQ